MNAYRILMVIFGSVSFIAASIFLVKFRSPTSIKSLVYSLKKGIALTEDQIVPLGFRMIVSAIAAEGLRVVWLNGLGVSNENRLISLILFFYFATAMIIYLIGYLKVRSRHLEGTTNER